MGDYDTANKYFRKTLDIDSENDFAKLSLRTIKEKTMPN